MDRMIIQCPIGGQETELQFDKKAMPGESGPCFMITANGCFKGYISRQKNGTYRPLGNGHFTVEELQQISERLQRSAGV